MARTVIHRYDCDGPDVRVKVGASGDVLRVCRSCRRYIVVVEPLPPELPPPPPGILSHVCRNHGAPVDARGRGCTQCAFELSLSKIQRRARRRREERAAEQADWWW